MTCQSVAWRIRTDRLLLRGWRESDAAALSMAVLANFDHLQPWLPWAGDRAEQSEAAKLTFIRKSRSEFLRGKTLGFAIFDSDEQTLLGSVGLHARIGSGAREIGYWIARDFARRGLATEAAGALTRLAFERLRMRFMEIHCDPANEPSAGVARRLGFTLRTTIPGCVPRESVPPREDMVWTMVRSDYTGSAAERIAMHLARDGETPSIASTGPP